MDARDIEPVLEVADVIQIGARNMQNYALLAEIGRSGCPVLIKRGLSATLEELLMAAEYVLKEGNEKVMLCERGIRTFETAYRFTLDLMAVPVLKELTHLPVVVDPSHAAGRRDLVEPLSLAAAAGGRRRHHRRGPPGSPRRRSATARRRCAPRTSPRYAARSSGLAGASRARRSGLASRRATSLIVAIVGAGLIGGSVGLAARRRLGAHVRGIDPQGARALGAGALDEACADLPAALDGADVAFVAAPVDVLRRRSPRRAGRRARRLRGHRRRLDQARGRRRRGADERFVGGHPLAGAEVAGVEHAREDLFDGATWYLTPTADEPGVLLERVHRLLTGLGARPAVIDADDARPHYGRRLAPAARARQRPRRAGRAARWAASGCRRPARASATRRASPAPTRRSGPGIYRANRDALRAAIDDALAAPRPRPATRWRATTAQRLGAWQSESAAAAPGAARAPASPAGRGASCAPPCPTGPASSPRSR